MRVAVPTDGGRGGLLGAKGRRQLSVCDRIGEGPRSRAARRPVEPCDSPSQRRPRHDGHSTASTPRPVPISRSRCLNCTASVRVSPARVAHLDAPGWDLAATGWHRDPPARRRSRIGGVTGFRCFRLSGDARGRRWLARCAATRARRLPRRPTACSGRVNAPSGRAERVRLESPHRRVAPSGRLCGPRPGSRRRPGPSPAPTWTGRL